MQTGPKRSSTGAASPAGIDGTCASRFRFYAVLDTPGRSYGTPNISNFSRSLTVTSKEGHAVRLPSFICHRCLACCFLLRFFHIADVWSNGCCCGGRMLMHRDTTQTLSSAYLKCIWCQADADPADDWSAAPTALPPHANGLADAPECEGAEPKEPVLNGPSHAAPSDCHSEGGGLLLMLSHSSLIINRYLRWTVLMGRNQHAVSKSFESAAHVGSLYTHMPCAMVCTAWLASLWLLLCAFRGSDWEL